MSWRVFGRCLSVTAALHPLPVGARKRSGRQTVSNHAQCDGGYHDIEQHAVQTREPVFVKQKEIDDRGKAAGSKPADKPPRGCPSAAPEHAERHRERIPSPDLLRPVLPFTVPAAEPRISVGY